MANQQLFRSVGRARTMPRAEARNAHGAPAYARSGRLGLAQLAATGCLSDTFYADAGDELKRVQDLAAQVSPEFVAKTAIYARQRGFMKDMPALLLALLTARRPDLVE